MASTSSENTPGEMPHIKEVFRTILQQHVQLDGELLAELMEKKLLTEGNFDILDDGMYHIPFLSKRTFYSIAIC